MAKGVTLNGTTFGVTSATSTFGGPVSITGTTFGIASGTVSTLNGLVTATNNVSITGNLFEVSTGATTLGGTLYVGSTSSFHGDIDMNGHSIINASNFNQDLDLNGYSIVRASNLGITTATKINLDGVTPQISCYVGTTSTSVLDILSDGVTIRGDLNVIGTTTQTTIQSSTVEVYDTNILLGYNTSDNSLLSGGGLTLGTSTSAPAIVFNNTVGYLGTGAWTTSIPLLKQGSATLTTAELSEEGTVLIYDHTSPSDPTKVVEIDNKGVTLGNKWRMVLDGNNLVFQYSNGGDYTTQYKLVPAA